MGRLFGTTRREQGFFEKGACLFCTGAAGHTWRPDDEMPISSIVKHASWTVRVLALTLFAWIGAGIVVNVAGYFLYSYPSSTENRTFRESHDREKTQTRAAYDVILERNLLKVSRSSPAGPREEHESDVVRPVAELGLKLRGTIAGSQDIARAILEDQREQKSYRIGEEVKGAKLLAVYRNKVIMDVGGQEQMLVIEDVKTRPGAPAASPGARRAARPSAGITLPGSDSGMTNIMKNLDQYIGKARVVPYFKGGQPYGFRVSNLSNDAMIYDLGVRSGDVIRSVNGIPIRTPEDAFTAYQQFQNESSLQVELERNGESTTVTVPLR